MVSWEKTWEVFPALLVSGLSFAAVQFYWSNFLETGLVDIIAAIVSLLVMTGFLHFWKPKNLVESQNPYDGGLKSHSLASILKGWSPFLLASIFILICGMPSLNQYLKFSGLTFPLPGLHNRVVRVPPVAPKPSPEAAVLDLNILAMPGTAVFAGALVAVLILGMSPAKALKVFGSTLRQLVPSMLAIGFMVGLAFVTRYSGMDTTLGLSLTRTGWIYPFFGTLLGWLGVALTGTDAGSNALFGNLQKVTAEQLNLSPVLMAAANTTGGVMGKMIDAQSIVVSSAATQQEGNEAAIFKAVFKHSIILACIVGGIVMLYAYVFPHWIP